MIKAAIFDMDGILFDTERLSTEGWVEASKAQGLELSFEFFLALLGLNDESVREALSEKLGPGFDCARALAAVDDYITRSIERDGMPVKSGVRELLDFLFESGIPAAIASSSNRARIEYNVARAGLSGKFRAFACGDEVLHGKPAPDIFLAAAEALGAEPGECLAFEDSPSGLAAAKRAGMKTIMVPDLHAPDEADLAGLFACLKTIDEAIALIEADR